MSQAPASAALTIRPDLHALVPSRPAVGEIRLPDLLAEEERLAFRAGSGSLAADESSRLERVSAEIDLRWGVFLGRV